MRHLKGFNEAWADKKAKLLKSLEERRETKPNVDVSQIPIFIKKMGELIDKKWEIFDIDNDKIDKLIRTSLGNDPYSSPKFKEYYSTDKTTTNTEILIVEIFNIGYSVGYFCSNKISRCDFDFEDFVGSLDSILRFDSNDSKEKLVWDGPDLTSSSLLACGPNIKYQIKNIKKEAERYDDELGQLKVIFGTVYQYGYNYGYEIGYVETRLREDELRKELEELIFKEKRTKEDNRRMEEIRNEIYG